MNEPLGIAIELINRRNKLAARLTPAARARVYPHLYGVGATNHYRVYAPRASSGRRASVAITSKRPSPRMRALSVEPQTTAIVQACAEQWEVDAGAIYSVARTPNLVLPRRAAIYLMRQLLALSTPTIGHIMGRDHTSIMTALRRHTETIHANADYAARFSAALSVVQAAFSK